MRKHGLSWRLGAAAVLGIIATAGLAGPAHADIDRGTLRFDGGVGTVSVDYIASPTQEVQRALVIHAEQTATSLEFIVDSRFIEVSGTCVVAFQRPSGQNSRVQCAPRRILDMNLGDRRNVVDLQASDAVQARITTGGEDDTVKVRALGVGVVANIRTGDGDDVVRFDDNRGNGGFAAILGGAGRDNIHTEGAGPINSGAGDDTVHVRNDYLNEVDCVDGDRKVTADLLDNFANCINVRAN